MHPRLQALQSPPVMPEEEKQMLKDAGLSFTQARARSGTLQLGCCMSLDGWQDGSVLFVLGTEVLVVDG